MTDTTVKTAVDEHEVRQAWKQIQTPEVDELLRTVGHEVETRGYVEQDDDFDLGASLGDIAFAAFSAGFRAARRAAS